jgi:hypothetical protein
MITITKPFNRSKDSILVFVFAVIFLLLPKKYRKYYRNLPLHGLHFAISQTSPNPFYWAVIKMPKPNGAEHNLNYKKYQGENG